MSHTSTKRVLTIRALLAFCLLAVGFLAASAPASAAVGSPDQECQAAFGSGYVGFKIDNVNESQLNGTYQDPATGFSVTISGVNTTDHTFDYTSSWPANVIVKGGPDQGELYPSSDSGTGLHPPVNPNNGQYYGISHITFCWQSAGEDKSLLKITKIADNPVIQNGGSVVFTLTVKNFGPATAENTVVSDLVPDGLTIDSADAPCTISGQLVECVAGSLPAGETRTYRIYATADPILPVDNPNDQLDISKVEQHISLQAGESRIAQITCGSDGIMTDGSVRVDHVDQGTGTLDSVEIHRLHSIDPGTYQTEVTNHATGQAQIKLFGVCLGKKTTSGHDLSVSPLISETFNFDAGTHTRELTCAPGTTPIAPGFAVSGSRAWLLASAPVGSQTRKFTLKVDQDGATATFSIRCLSNLTSNGDQLQWQPISKEITIGPGAVASEQLTCGVGYKGVVAGWEYEDGLIPLGNDPQPITRVFKIWNPTTEPLKAKLYLLCLKLRTGSHFVPITFVNTAHVSSTTQQAPGAVLSDSATVTVESGSGPVPPPEVSDDPDSSVPVVRGVRLLGRALLIRIDAAGQSGKVAVKSLKRARVNGRTLRRGSTLGRSAIAGKSVVKVKLGRLATRAIRAGKLRRVKVTVKSHGKKKSRVLRIKRR